MCSLLVVIGIVPHVCVSSRTHFLHPCCVPILNNATDHRPWFASGFGWSLRQSMSFISLYQATAYASATGCLLGATCFLVATCAECVPSVSQQYWWCDGHSLKMYRQACGPRLCTHRFTQASSLEMGCNQSTTGSFCSAQWWAANSSG